MKPNERYITHKDVLGIGLKSIKKPFKWQKGERFRVVSKGNCQYFISKNKEHIVYINFASRRNCAIYNIYGKKQDDCNICFIGNVITIEDLFAVLMYCGINPNN